jgi:hypothetical protein
MIKYNSASRNLYFAGFGLRLILLSPSAVMDLNHNHYDDISEWEVTNGEEWTAGGVMFPNRTVESDGTVGLFKSDAIAVTPENIDIGPFKYAVVATLAGAFLLGYEEFTEEKLFVAGSPAGFGLSDNYLISVGDCT